MNDASTQSAERTHEFNIVVNGKAKKVDHQLLQFDEVVKLAYPTPPSPGEIIYTITFHNADQNPPNDTLVAGQSVTVRNGTRFDVKHAVRS